MIPALACMGAVLIAVSLAYLVRAWRDKGPMTRDLCQVCGKELRARERVEIVTDEMWNSEFGGTTGWIETYCQKHSPKKVKA